MDIIAHCSFDQLRTWKPHVLDLKDAIEVKHERHIIICCRWTKRRCTVGVRLTRSELSYTRLIARYWL